MATIREPIHHIGLERESTYRNTLFILLNWSVFDLHLFLKVIHGVAELQIVRNVGHTTNFLF